MGYGGVVDLCDVYGAVELAPEAVEKSGTLRDALFPGGEVVRQVRRQVSLEHLVLHVGNYTINRGG